MMRLGGTMFAGLVALALCAVNPSAEGAKPPNGKPPNGKPPNGKPANGKPANGKPANGKGLPTYSSCFGEDFNLCFGRPWDANVMKSDPDWKRILCEPFNRAELQYMAMGCMRSDWKAELSFDCDGDASTASDEVFLEGGLGYCQSLEDGTFLSKELDKLRASNFSTAVTNTAKSVDDSLATIHNQLRTSGTMDPVDTSWVEPFPYYRGSNKTVVSLSTACDSAYTRSAAASTVLAEALSPTLAANVAADKDCGYQTQGARAFRVLSNAAASAVTVKVTVTGIPSGQVVALRVARGLEAADRVAASAGTAATTSFITHHGAVSSSSPTATLATNLAPGLYHVTWSPRKPVDLVNDALDWTNVRVQVFSTTTPDLVSTSDFRVLNLREAVAYSVNGGAYNQGKWHSQLKSCSAYQVFGIPQGPYPIKSTKPIWHTQFRDAKGLACIRKFEGAPLFGNQFMAIESAWPSAFEAASLRSCSKPDNACIAAISGFANSGGDRDYRVFSSAKLASSINSLSYTNPATGVNSGIVGEFEKIEIVGDGSVDSTGTAITTFLSNTCQRLSGWSPGAAYASISMGPNNYAASFVGNPLDMSLAKMSCVEKN